MGQAPPYLLGCNQRGRIVIGRVHVVYTHFPKTVKFEEDAYEQENLLIRERVLYELPVLTSSSLKFDKLSA